MSGLTRSTQIALLVVAGLVAFPTLAQAASVQADFDGDGNADLAIGVPHDNVGKQNAGAVNVIYGSGAGLTATDNQLWHQDSPTIAGKGEFGDFFGWSLAAGDFDGDSHDDLAVGIRDEGVGGENRVGAVQVIYGSAAGLTATGNQLWHQDRSGILGKAEAGDQFGAALTSGNFDGDDFDDLAVGVPEEDLTGGRVSAGVVHAIYGSASGLTATGDQLWSQDTPGIAGGAEFVDEFGWSLAAGDFDDDGIDDLAVGVRSEDLGGHEAAGAVHAIYGGSGAGLTAEGSQLWNQDTPGIAGGAEELDLFGVSLAAGDFDGDASDDLAVGAPFEGFGGHEGAGVVHAIYGSPAGLTAAGSQLWSQDASGIGGGAEKNDAFGDSLTAGDFNGFSDDLAVGAPLENLGDASNAGVVHAIYGSGAGLTSLGNQVWSEDLAGILDAAGDDDEFGRPLTAGDFDGDGADDLGASTPGENLDCPKFGCGGDLGAVHAIYSSDSAAGLTADGDQLWHRATPGIEGNAGVADLFGFALPG